MERASVYTKRFRQQRLLCSENKYLQLEKKIPPLPHLTQYASITMGVYIGIYLCLAWAYCGFMESEMYFYEYVLTRGWWWFAEERKEKNHDEEKARDTAKRCDGNEMK